MIHNAQKCNFIVSSLTGAPSLHHTDVQQCFQPPRTEETAATEHARDGLNANELLIWTEVVGEPSERCRTATESCLRSLDPLPSLQGEAQHRAPVRKSAD